MCESSWMNESGTWCERLGGRLPDDDFVTHAAVALGDHPRMRALQVAQLALELGDARLQPSQRVLEREHVLDARVIEAERGGERLDALQSREIGVGVEPPATGRAARHDQPPRLVQAQR